MSAAAAPGNPAQQALAWLPYDTTARETMSFDVRSHVVADMDRNTRIFWNV